MAPHNHPQVCVCACLCLCVSFTHFQQVCLPSTWPGMQPEKHTCTPPVDKKNKNKKPLELNREAKEAYLPDNRRESWPHTNDCVCVQQGSHETATSVKVLFFIVILFLKPQYHPLTFHLNEHYPQQCLPAAGNISWPLAALMCHLCLDVWEVPIHPPQWSLHHHIDAAIYSFCTTLLNNRCCCSDHFASYALIRRSSGFFFFFQSSFHKL